MAYFMFDLPIAQYCEMFTAKPMVSLENQLK